MPVLGVILILFSMTAEWDWKDSDAVALTGKFRTMRECEKSVKATVKSLKESGRNVEVVSALCYGPKDVEA
jgi:hypothetical protein